MLAAKPWARMTIFVMRVAGDIQARTYTVIDLDTRHGGVRVEPET